MNIYIACIDQNNSNIGTICLQYYIISHIMTHGQALVLEDIIFHHRVNSKLYLFSKLHLSFINLLKIIVLAEAL